MSGTISRLYTKDFTDMRKGDRIALIISVTSLIISLLSMFITLYYEEKLSDIRKLCWRIAPSNIEGNTEKNYQDCLRSHGLEK